MPFLLLSSFGTCTQMWYVRVADDVGIRAPWELILFQPCSA